jgi:hypothetical protein
VYVSICLHYVFFICCIYYLNLKFLCFSEGYIHDYARFILIIDYDSARRLWGYDVWCTNQKEQALSGLTPPHCCTYPKSESVFTMSMSWCYLYVQWLSDSINSIHWYCWGIYVLDLVHPYSLVSNIKLMWSWQITEIPA